jgi:hypothetical protein
MGSLEVILVTMVTFVTIITIITFVTMVILLTTFTTVTWEIPSYLGNYDVTGTIQKRSKVKLRQTRQDVCVIHTFLDLFYNDISISHYMDIWMHTEGLPVIGHDEETMFFNTAK